MLTVLITGSSGLIGSEAVQYFDKMGWQVYGVDNNGRREFFGQEGDTNPNLNRLIKKCKNFRSVMCDIRDRDFLFNIFLQVKPDLVLHFAAQPAHDYSWNNPLTDFQVNALGTMHVLEATRQLAPEAVFIYTSTSKVYGTHVNNYVFKELKTRMDYNSEDFPGINETCKIDQDTIHSLFGASKLAADIMCQEYGNYFGLKTTILRPGCMTGRGHAGVELHGFLSYLIKCVSTGREYKVFDDLKGKRVRDNIHSFDLVTACHEIYKNPPKPGTVFNIGGGRENSCSIIEAIDKAERLTGKTANYTITNQPRNGDHVVYITDQRKFMNQYPSWGLCYNLRSIFVDIIEGYRGDEYNF